MESTTIINTNNIQLIRYLINIKDIDLSFKSINLNIIIQSINELEYLTGYKLFNKLDVCNQIIKLSSDNLHYINAECQNMKINYETIWNNLLVETKNIISKNLIMQIDFNTMFKSNLNLSIIIKDDIIILYKNKRVDINNLLDIKNDLIKNNINDFPIIYELYIDTLSDIIMQFINKDLLVKYYCINIPLPYWKLFELKCNKINSNLQYNEKCKELDCIILGEYYKINKYNKQINHDEEFNKNVNQEIIDSVDKEQKKLDDHYRMEVISYLSDDQVEKYLKVVEQIDNFDKNIKLSDIIFINIYIKTLIDAVSNIDNTIANFYYIYKLYIFICKIPEFIKTHELLRKTVTNKINEFSGDLYIIQMTGIKLADALTLILNKTKDMIDTIEKLNNSNYISQWNKNSNEQILIDYYNNNNDL